MKHAESWSDTKYSSASDALSAILELVRQHEVRVGSVAYRGIHHRWRHRMLRLRDLRDCSQMCQV